MAAEIGRSDSLPELFPAVLPSISAFSGICRTDRSAADRSLPERGAGAAGARGDLATVLLHTETKSRPLLSYHILPG